MSSLWDLPTPEERHQWRIDNHGPMACVTPSLSTSPTSPWTCPTCSREFTLQDGNVWVPTDELEAYEASKPELLEG